MHHSCQITIFLLFSQLHCNSFDKATQTNIKCSWRDLDPTCNFRKEEHVQTATLMSSDQNTQLSKPITNPELCRWIINQVCSIFYMRLVVLKQTDGLCRDLLVHQLFPGELWCPEYTQTHTKKVSLRGCRVQMRLYKLDIQNEPQYLFFCESWQNSWNSNRHAGFDCWDARTIAITLVLSSASHDIFVHVHYIHSVTGK